MAHANADTMRKIDEAMTAGDVDAFFAHFTDDVKLHASGRNQLAGDHEGKEAFKALFAKFMEATGDYSFDNHAYLADEEHGVTLQTSKLQKGGQTLELQEAFIMHFRDGKVSEMWYVPLNQAAFDAWIG